jgi:ankyrin repeat protein
VVRGILAKCLDEQGVIARLMDTGSSVDIKNGFNYNPLHYAALFGSATLLKSVLDAKPILDASTSLGHTAVHLAAIRGHTHLLPQLYLAGVPKEATDRRGRSVVDIACLHRYVVPTPCRKY